MNLATAVAAIALPTLAGVGIVSLIAPRLRLYGIERLALGFLVGAGALAGLWFLLTPFYSVVAPVWLLSGLLVLAVFAGRTDLSSLFRAGMNERRWSPGSLDIALLAIVIVEVVMLFAAALRTPLGWDGLFNFEMKARMLFEHTPQGQFPVDYLSDSSRQWSHPQYPMLIPVAEFWVYCWIGAVDQSAIKLLFPFFYVSLIVLISSAIARAAAPRVGLAAGAALGLLPPLTLLPGAASGYADVPLAAAVCGALCYAHRGFRTGDPSSFTLAGVLAAIAVWTKTEGLLLGVAFGVLAMATAWWSRGESPTLHVRFRDAAKMLWIPLVCAAPWLVLQRLYGTPGPDFMSISPEHFLQSAGRAPSIAATFARELLRPGHWALVWPCWLCAALVMAWQRDAELADGFLFAVVALSLVLYVGVFTMSAWSDVTEHIRWALPRLLVALAPIALMSTVLVMWDNLSAADA